MKNRANMGVLTREEEKKYRDGVKKVFELGVDSREVELKMKQSAELNAINEGADAKLAGLSDDEASEVMKTSMNSDPDADDYTESKKKKMMLAVRGVVAGGKTGQLKFQKEPKIELRVCLTSAANTITVADIKKAVSESAKAKDSVLMKSAETTEAPEKDELTQRTCGTVVFPVKDGKSMASVKQVFAELTFSKRRSLSGRYLNTDETSVSSGQSQVIVTGDTTQMCDVFDCSSQPSNTVNKGALVAGDDAATCCEAPKSTTPTSPETFADVAVASASKLSVAIVWLVLPVLCGLVW